MKQRIRNLLLCATAGLLVLLQAACSGDKRPNILIVISDDQSWLHTSAAGDPVVRTPHFDRLAEGGVYFTHAFCAAPNCSPSRAAMLTGRPIWQLGAAANLFGPLDVAFDTYPDLLAASGYMVGYTGKGWGPGEHSEGGRDHNPAGPAYNALGIENYVDNFAAFLAEVPPGSPFCFWLGSLDPHSPYDPATPRRPEMNPAAVRIPSHLPDDADVRERFIDYYAEVERFDRHLGQAIELVRQRGELENTLIIVTSDNGIDLSRGKLNLYDLGTRAPLVVAWPARVPGGRSVDDLVSLIDIAPTLLQCAGEDVPPEMVGRSLLATLTSQKSGRIDSERGQVFSARERHSLARQGLSYPMRAIRTHDYLYVRNLEPTRWPAGPPPSFRDSGAHPILRPLINRPANRALFRLNYAKRPAEELYDVGQDPEQIHNLADDPARQGDKQRLAAALDRHLKETGDPRIHGDDGGWDAHPDSEFMKRGQRHFEPGTSEADREARRRRAQASHKDSTEASVEP